VTLRSKRTVVILLAVLASAIFIAGMAAAFVNRHRTICSDGKPPVAQRGGILGQTEYRCHNGKIVTLSS
jgi:hypothetical protein